MCSTRRAVKSCASTFAAASKQVVAKLATALDNLAHRFARPPVRLEHGGQRHPGDRSCATARSARWSKARSRSRSASPSVADGSRDTLYVADVFALAHVSMRAPGKVTDIARSHAAGTPIGYPVAVTANQRHVIVTNNEGPVQRYERSTMRLVQSWRDTHAGNAIELPSGALIVARDDARQAEQDHGQRDERAACGNRRRSRGAARARHSRAITPSTSARWRRVACRAST